MIGKLEGTERCVTGITRGNRNAPKPGEGALGIASIKKAGSARGSGGGVVKEDKESATVILPLPRLRAARVGGK